jgi:ATP-dependent exoDNAse (exonuclease V) beta subunit
VVDFKTNRHEGGALEEFLARESRRYRPQLARYAELAARLGPEPIRCALYFPLLSVLREVLL